VTGTLTLIGSGEFLPGMVAVHRAILERIKHPFDRLRAQPERNGARPSTSGDEAPQEPKAVFIDTPAGFQANVDELSQTARKFFKAELGFALDVASLRHSRPPRASPEQIEIATALLADAHYIVAGPGSPTYAVRHWRATMAEILAQRLAEGAQLVFASSAAIALSRLALPVYEIYKVGDDPYWAEGLDLLRPYGLDLAIVPHWNNREPRCFVGLARFDELAAQLPLQTVLLGIDENTAVTLDLDARTAAVAGEGGVTIQSGGVTHFIPSGNVFDLSVLTPAGASARIIKITPMAAEANLQSPITSDPRPLYVPAPVRQWAAQRDALRAEKKFSEADKLRDRITAIGYSVKDSPSGPVFSLAQYSNANSVPSQLDKPDVVEWSVTLLAHDNADEVIRAARSALHWGAGHSLEVVIVDDRSGDGARVALADLACDDERVRLVFLSEPLGEGGGRNAGLRAARGKLVAILGGHMEIAGDIFTPLTACLADASIGATGSNPLVSSDLFTFNPAPTPEADAIEFYLFAFRRDRLKQVGWLDEKFVFYRNLDLDWCLAFKDKGLRLVAAPSLPLVVHEHPYLRMDPVERDKLSKKNYRRFLDKWRDRKDLLISSQS
jgi:hypothetical protein